MKTSNAIFLSFLIFLFGGIILLFVGAKYNEGYNDKENFTIQEKSLPTFSVIVAESGAIFRLKGGNENKIIQTYRKDSIPNTAPFVVRNDTLFISSVKEGIIKEKNYAYRFALNIFCVNIKSIIAKENSDIVIDNIKANAFDVSMNKSGLHGGFDKVAFLSIQAKDSRINLYGEIENLTTQLDKTELSASVKKRILSLSGNLKNGSKCNFTISNSVNLHVDETSNYYSYDTNTNF